MTRGEAFTFLVSHQPEGELYAGELRLDLHKINAGLLKTH